MTLVITTGFKPITMKGPSGDGERAYEDISGETIIADTTRITYHEEAKIETFSTYGAVPISQNMGRQPYELRLQLIWNKYSSEMKSYAESLTTRKVPCIMNLFMPGMRVTVDWFDEDGFDPVAGRVKPGHRPDVDIFKQIQNKNWMVDEWRVDKTNARGRKYTGELTLVECNEIEDE